MPAAAQENQNVRQKNVRAQDIPLQPLRDLNLVKDEVPPLLIDIANDPYSAEGLQSCNDIEGAIADLDVMLGDDVDVAAKDRSDLQKGANSAGRLAKSFAAGFLPFRKFIRELSGSRETKNEFEAMVTAALIRRGFLKGLGLERDCAWPARPAEAMLNYDEDDLPVTSMVEPVAETPAAQDGPTFVSKAVVQPTD